MLLGLRTATAVFQALVVDVLRDMLNKVLFVYLNHILIFSEMEEEHIQHVRLVLRRLLQNSLFIKKEKSEFHVPSVAFLGFAVQQGLLFPDPSKIQAVDEWPTPTSRKHLHQFLGFANLSLIHQGLQ